MQLTPHGLYDPRFEHDACGIGAVVNISGRRERKIIECAKQVILNLHHRGAAGSDDVTGDGAGILIQIPHEQLCELVGKFGFSLPAPGEYGAAMVFAPKDEKLAAACEGLLARAVEYYGMRMMGWRDVPGNKRDLGELAISAEPMVKQAFIDAGGHRGDELERKLYMARRRAERLVRERLGPPADDFYICSMSARTMVYKGMFMAHQLFSYYPDLADERMISALAVVHQRYSTNTMPNWKLAQPFRYIAHNGEINTLSGNRNRMRAREKIMSSPLFGKDIADLLPVLSPTASDSACFDATLELLVQGGRSLPHAMMMLIPEAFGDRYHISIDKRAFYEYHTTIQEPWDGPAAMVFTDGRTIGGTLDRNGLRPARYTVTNDGLVVLGSEVGVVDLPPEQIQQKGRLQPGLMFMVDTVEQRIVTDNEIKSKIARQKPYRRWLSQNRIELRGLFSTTEPPAANGENLYRRLRSFGYTREDLRAILVPMARDGQEPVGSMGNDAALAVLSDKPKLLYNYFKQMFAQVTNPAIDPIREELVMSLNGYIGSEGNILDETPQHCHTFKITHPILTNWNLEKLRRVSRGDFLATTLPMLFRVDGGSEMEKVVEELCRQASLAIKSGYTILILSDRGVDQNYAPIPSLLALSAVHHHLIREKTRNQVALIVESGEPREVMHFGLLIGYGASAVNPYLAIETLEDLHARGYFPPDYSFDKVLKNYRKAVDKGLLKIFSKMGISTLQSYFGAQVFEAIGLNRAVVERYFAGTPSRLEGVGLDVLAREAMMKHEFAMQPPSESDTELEVGGDYQFRLRGERHLLNPQTISKLQHAVRQSKFETFQEFSQLINRQNRELYTLRGLLELRPTGPPVPLEEVEPAAEIVKRFSTGAMSFGSISKEAHETLAIAMNRLGGKSNTGEGGEDAARFRPDADGNLRRSAVKQVASGRFGVTIHYLVNADELQIKIAQGAKPGEGGQLPGHKVDEVVARIRYSIPGVRLISPPPHHDIYSIEDLAQLIYDLKNANPQARISVKLVAESGVGTVAAGVAKAHADLILISGYDGGTGASPVSSIRHAGIPWELGLSETQQVLVMNDLRSRVRLQVDGKLATGRDVAIAALLGAEEFGFSTLPLISLGCVMMRKCHLNTCPVGIATQDPELRKKFAGQPEHAINFFFFVAEELRQIMVQLGFRKVDELVGRVDCLVKRQEVDHWKARGLDFSAILYHPHVPARVGRRCLIKQDHGLEKALDYQLIEHAREALENATPVSISLPIRNVHRTVGTMLSGEIARRYGARGLPDDTIQFKFTGSAGQSFGAFLAPGVTLELEGDANDYTGKGLSGGKLIVYPPRTSLFLTEENILVGNVVLYGATSGEAYFNGMAGERFAVRNSGATAVVESVGDHGCEYMTRGTVIVLGKTGRNFAAGMTGGIAYVLDETGEFVTVRCNRASVDLEPLVAPPDIDLVQRLIARHADLTGSPRARWILENWDTLLPKFVKVFPHEYKRVLGIPRLPESAVLWRTTSPPVREVLHG